MMRSFLVFLVILLGINTQYPYHQMFDQANLLVGNWTINSVGSYSADINVEITANTISFNYCNQQTYGYTTTGSRITITDGQKTKRMCKMAPPAEDEVREALVNAATYSVIGNMIVLRDGRNHVTITFTRKFNFGNQGSTTPVAPTQPVAPSQPLASIVGIWTATTIKNQPVSFAVTIEDKTIRYRYCNSINRNYEISGNTINIKQGISTMMACFNQNPSENVVSSAFSEAKTFSVNNGVLTLYDANGAAVVTLTSGQPSIIGSYKIISINGLSTLELNKVDVTITATSIQYRYCNGKSLSYTTNSNNIDIQSGISTLMFCEGLNPS